MINLPSYIAKYHNPSYSTPKHIRLLEQKAIESIIGKNKRIIVTMPPRHGKSEYISKYFPAWLMLNFSNLKILLSSYESHFATKWSREAREVYLLFRNDLIVSRHNYWENNQKSVLNAVGAGGSLTGKGANFLIIDDPYKNHEIALSATQREKIWNWFNSVVYTRLEPGGVIIIVLTRWHKDDLAGRLIKESKEHWQVINLPALAKENDILQRAPGEALWPERFNEEALSKIKNQIGTYWWNALYQQDPISEENQIFKQEWFNYYEIEPNFEIIVQSWDTAFKDKEKNDYSVCTTWGFYDNKFYLIDIYRNKLRYPDLRIKAIELYERYKPRAVVVEDAASGQSLIQDLKEFTNIPIVAKKASGDKLIKAHEISPLFESGKIYIKPVHKFIIDEFVEFPFSAHDDIVDAFYYSLSYLKQYKKITNFPFCAIEATNYYKGV